jgi:hypothetical protein
VDRAGLTGGAEGCRLWVAAEEWGGEGDPAVGGRAGFSDGGAELGDGTVAPEGRAAAELEEGAVGPDGTTADELGVGSAESDAGVLERDGGAAAGLGGVGVLERDGGAGVLERDGGAAAGLGGAVLERDGGAAAGPGGAVVLDGTTGAGPGGAGVLDLDGPAPPAWGGWPGWRDGPGWRGSSGGTKARLPFPSTRRQPSLVFKPWWRRHRRSKSSKMVTCVWAQSARWSVCKKQEAPRTPRPRRWGRASPTPSAGRRWGAGPGGPRR